MPDSGGAFCNQEREREIHVVVVVDSNVQDTHTEWFGGRGLQEKHPGSTIPTTNQNLRTLIVALIFFGFTSILERATRYQYR